MTAPELLTQKDVESILVTAESNMAFHVISESTYHIIERLVLDLQAARAALKEVCDAAGEWHSEVVKIEGIKPFPPRLTEAVMRARAQLPPEAPR